VEIFTSEGVNYIGGNFEPVSTTPAANFATGTAGVVDTGVIYHRSTTPVVHLELRARNFFEKIRNGPNGILRDKAVSETTNR
jgi:hypothetical protein